MELRKGNKLTRPTPIVYRLMKREPFFIDDEAVAAHVVGAITVRDMVDLSIQGRIFEAVPADRKAG